MAIDDYMKTWLEGESGGTPIDADGMNDKEGRDKARGDAGLEFALAVAAGGVELGYADIQEDFITGSSSLVDIPGLSVTVTIGSRPVVVRCGFDLANSTSGLGGGVYLNEDGTDIGGLALMLGAAIWLPVTGQRRRGVGAGSHTWKLRARNLGGGSTLTLHAGDGSDPAGHSPGFLQVIEV